MIDQSIKIVTKFWIITLPSVLLSLVILRQFLITKRRYLKFYLFGAVWFTVGLIPVITITNHTFPMYLSFSGIGFLYIIITSLKNSALVIRIVIISLWFIISFANLQFTRSSHWIRNEQAISKAYMGFVKELVSNPPQDSIFHFKPANHVFSKNHAFLLVEGQDTLRQSLADQNAIQVIYKNSSIKSIFTTHQQKVEPPKNATIFEISPRED